VVRVYLAGPITGVPEGNFPAFARAAERVRGAGFEVVSPTEIPHADPDNWALCMREDLREMVGCDMVAMLPGWAGSRGAVIERGVAKDVQIPVVELGSLFVNE